jgi:putative MFS transporter
VSTRAPAQPAPTRAAALTPEALGQRLDRVPPTWFHRRLLFLSGMGWMFDAMDILLLGSVLAAVSRQWGLAPSTTALISSANLLGMFFGAAASGWLADRYGRRDIFQSTLLVYSIFTGLSAAAAGPFGLAVLRFLAGLGLGGELPVASTLVSEFAPSRYRGLMVVLLESFWAFGSVLAALIGYVVIPSLGWQVAFLIGALPAFFVFALRRGIPESPRFLIARRRYNDAEAVVMRVERSAGLVVKRSRQPLLPSRKATPLARRALNLGWLFGRAYRRRTLVLWVLWATMNFSYYGIFLWLPTQFVSKGFSLDQALLFNLIVSLAQIPGYFSAAWLVERVGRKPTLVAYLAACAVAAFFFGQLTTAPQLGEEAIPAILAAGSLVSFFNLGAWGVVYTYTTELYPTGVRAAGAGAATGFGRLFAILAPFSIPLQLQLFGSQANVFLAFVAIMVIGAAVMFGAGIETRGRSLEELAAVPA